MDVDPSLRGDFRLGDWRVQPALCRLSENGRTVQVRPKVMDLLVFLAGAPGAVVSKETLLNEVWRTEAVSESALTRTVTELRQALGDSVESPKILETIPKRGYRLIATVSAAQPWAPADAVRVRRKLGLTYAVALASLSAVVVVGVLFSNVSGATRRTIAVSSGDSNHVHWRGDGRELFYQGGENLMTVPIDWSADGPVPGTPHVLFKSSGRFEPAAMGDKFLVLQVAANPDVSRVHVLIGWQRELRQ